MGTLREWRLQFANCWVLCLQKNSSSCRRVTCVQKCNFTQKCMLSFLVHLYYICIPPAILSIYSIILYYYPYYICIPPAILSTYSNILYYYPYYICIPPAILSTYSIILYYYPYYICIPPAYTEGAELAWMRKQSFIIEACHMPGTVVGCHILCLGSCLARGFALQLFVQTYHRLLQHFDTSITNAYSTHFVKSSGLNAKAKFH